MIKRKNSMTKHHILRASLIACGAVLLNTACTFEQDAIFEESASLRITHRNESLKNRLVDQSADGNHGWLIQYFVAGTDDADFEGFNLFGRFYQNGKVTLAGNHRFLRTNPNAYAEHTSTYEMLAEEGPVLSFNTWNDILTVFEDPVDPSTKQQNGVGMNGDHNLVLRSYQDNEIMFSGERHSASVRFIPCDRPWQEYMDAVNKTKRDITSSAITSYYVTNGKETKYFSGLQRGYFNFCDRVEDPLENTVLSCVFTPTGFRIEAPDTLGANLFQEFKMAADSTCLVSEDGNVKVIAMWDEYILKHTAIWKLKTDAFSARQQELFAQIDAALKKYNSAASLASIGLGRSTGGNAVVGLVFTFYTNTAKTKTNTVGLALNQSKAAFGQIKIESKPDDAIDKNMTAIGKVSPDLINAARSFAITLNGTYNVTPNSYFLPTGAKFTSLDGSSSFEMNN